MLMLALYKKFHESQDESEDKDAVDDDYDDG